MRFVGDLALRSDESGLELNIGLDLVHQGRIAVTQHATQTLLRHRGADGARRRADHARRLARKRVLAPRSAGPVDGVLQSAGYRPVYSGVTKSTASTSAMDCLSARATGG